MEMTFPLTKVEVNKMCAEDFENEDDEYGAGDTFGEWLFQQSMDDIVKGLKELRTWDMESKTQARLKLVG